MNFYIYSFLFVLSLNGVIAATNSSKGALSRYQVWVVSALPSGTDPLFLHCWSSDDDLGTHFLPPGPHGFHWHFRENISQSTKFKCEFVWINKNIAFYVFDKHLSGKCKGRGGICYWLVMETAFYFANYINPFPKDLELMYSW
ncbi:hypothetical protein RDI58_010958 [Solanum bulbocastanum]|uniref:S-protein homolog n=1 Tax=Solanum bulbocastanum TaxID=147425 RepID=A0AAN8YGU8_SOLBU